MGRQPRAPKHAGSEYMGSSSIKKDARNQARHQGASAKAAARRHAAARRAPAAAPPLLTLEAAVARGVIRPVGAPSRDAPAASRTPKPPTGAQRRALKRCQQPVSAAPPAALPPAAADVAPPAPCLKAVAAPAAADVDVSPMNDTDGAAPNTPHAAPAAPAAPRRRRSSGGDKDDTAAAGSPVFTEEAPNAWAVAGACFAGAGLLAAGAALLFGAAATVATGAAAYQTTRAAYRGAKSWFVRG